VRPAIIQEELVNVFVANFYDDTTGFARCEVLARSQDSQGRKLARVTIAKPDSLESMKGLSEFEVLESQISE
jgi:hypothetical protein